MKLSWVKLTFVEWIRSELDWVGLRWVDLIWDEFSWVELIWVDLRKVELNCIDLSKSLCQLIWFALSRHGMRGVSNCSLTSCPPNPTCDCTKESKFGSVSTKPNHEVKLSKPNQSFSARFQSGEFWGEETPASECQDLLWRSPFQDLTLLSPKSLLCPPSPFHYGWQFLKWVSE